MANRLRKDGRVHLPLTEREVEFLRSAIVAYLMRPEDMRYLVLNRTEIGHLEDRLIGIADVYYKTVVQSDEELGVNYG